MIVQVAGVHDLTEAEVIIGAGATHLGLPLRLPDGREDLSEAAARTLIHAVRERIHTVVITYQSDARAIHEFVQWLGADGVQLHGPIAPAEVAKLRVLAPRLFIIKSLVVTGDDARDLLRTVPMMCVDPSISAARCIPLRSVPPSSTTRIAAST